MNTTDRYREWFSGVNYLVYHRKLISQAELGRQTGTDPSYLNAIFRGRKIAGADLQDKIEKVLGFAHDAIRSIGRETARGNMPNEAELERLRETPAGGSLVQAKESPAIEDATKLAMRCLCEGIIQWWIETHGTAPIVPDTFIAEFAERFPEYAVWRKEFFEQVKKEAMP